MVRISLAPIAVGCLLAVASWGCTWVPQTKFEAAQSQNRVLTEQNSAQLAEIQNLKAHARTIEDQLIKSEQQLAALDDQRGRDRRKMANLKTERERMQQFAGLARPGSAVPDGLSGRLEELARRYPSLQYDAQTGISKLDTDVLFDSGDASLKPGADKMLREFAAVFQAPEAAQLKIMVVGHTDSQGIRGREIRSKYPDNWHLSAGRALAVADGLRKAGIPEGRMGVAGFGQYQPLLANDTSDSRQRNRRVEVFVVGPDTPVVGWTETHGSVYR